MRIIAGSLKGRRLRSPDWPGLRPTSDRLRETLFNILADRVPEAIVLDLYAGTGAIGLEALSRGARAATFIDRDRRATALIHDHATRFGVLEQCEIVCRPAPEALDQAHPAPYDLIIADPPYDASGIGAILSAAGARLARDGILVHERDRRAAPCEAAGLEMTRSVVSGRSSLDFYRPIADPVDAEGT